MEQPYLEYQGLTELSIEKWIEDREEEKTTNLHLDRLGTFDKQFDFKSLFGGTDRYNRGKYRGPPEVVGILNGVVVTKRN